MGYAPLFETNATMADVLAALRHLRIQVAAEEFDLHLQVARCLDAAGLPYQREYRLGPGNRIDFFVGGIGVEVKKGKPNAGSVLGQLTRYAASPEVIGLILVIERYLDVPAQIAGKPCASLGLRKQWGVAT